MTIEERNDIVVQNMKLVHYLAHKIYIPKRAYFSYEDVVQEGMIGLIKSVEGFNPNVGYEFATYASMMIKGYMMRFIRENQYNMKYSRSDIDACVKIQRTNKQVNELTNEDLAKLGINKTQLSTIMSMISGISLDDYVADSDDSVSVLDTVADNSEELSEEYQESAMNDIKDKVLNSFKPIYHDVIDEWYYSKLLGISAGQSYLAAKYKISQPQIGRIIRKFKSEFLEELKSSGYKVSDYQQE